MPLSGVDRRSIIRTAISLPFLFQLIILFLQVLIILQLQYVLYYLQKSEIYTWNDILNKLLLNFWLFFYCEQYPKISKFVTFTLDECPELIYQFSGGYNGDKNGYEIPPSTDIFISVSLYFFSSLIYEC